nr:hypothetical protein [Sphingomonas sp. BGYR3]
MPSRDFDTTIAFYAPLGFAVAWRGGGWMILERGAMTLEFFPWPDLDPATSSFGACLRMDDIEPVCAAALAAGVPDARAGFPRLHPPTLDPASGRTIGYLIDPDGSLLRLIRNPAD